MTNESYPYMRIAKQFGLPYEVVLNFAQSYRETVEINRGLATMSEDEYVVFRNRYDPYRDRLQEFLQTRKEIESLMVAIAFAAQDFRRIQREGW